MAKAASFQNLNATADDTRFNQLIWDTQVQLAGSFDWSFLKKRWTLNAAASSRYISFPFADDEGLICAPNFDRPASLMIKWNQIWQPIEYGIDEYPEFNYLDSDRNQVLDPVQRWQFYDEGQLEIWPMPASGQELRFVGQRMLNPLSLYTYTSSGADDASSNGNWSILSNSTGSYYKNNTSTTRYMHFLVANNVWIINQSATDVTLSSALYVATNILGTWALGAAGVIFGLTTPPVFTLATANAWNDSASLDLDDMLVAYFTAAEWLGEDNSKYKTVLSKAQTRLASIRGTNLTRDDIVLIGRGEGRLGRKAIRQVPLVLVAGSTH